MKRTKWIWIIATLTLIIITSFTIMKFFPSFLSTKQTSFAKLENIRQQLQKKSNRLLQSPTGKAYSKGDINYLIAQINEPKSSKQRQFFFKTLVNILDREPPSALSLKDKLALRDTIFQFLVTKEGSKGPQRAHNARARTLAARTLRKLPPPNPKSVFYKKFISTIQDPETTQATKQLIAEIVTNWRTVPKEVAQLLVSFSFSKIPTETQTGFQVTNQMLDKKIQRQLLSGIHKRFRQVTPNLQPLAFKMLISNSHNVDISIDTLKKHIPSEISRPWDDAIVFAAERIGPTAEWQAHLNEIRNRTDNKHIKLRINNLLAKSQKHSRSHTGAKHEEGSK